MVILSIGVIRTIMDINSIMKTDKYDVVYLIKILPYTLKHISVTVSAVSQDSDYITI